MSVIKNLRLLEGIVSQSDLEKMEYAGARHKSYANITFKVISVSDKKVMFSVSQGKSAAGNYQTAKRLIEIVHETFDRFFPGRKVNAGPLPYKEPAPNQVTHEWIVEKMQTTGTRLKTIADETGIDYTQLSTIVNGATISAPMKAVFWYFFLARELEKKYAELTDTVPD